jgi:hypothetical protein
VANQINRKTINWLPIKYPKEKTGVTLTQDNIHSEKEKEHTTEIWKMVLK